MLDYSPDAVERRLQNAPSLLDMLRVSAERRPDHPAIVFYRKASDPAPEIWTYTDLLQRTEATAGALAAIGIGPEDGVSILLPTIPESIPAFVAASTVGVAFPLNLLLSAEAMAHQLNLANTKAAIVMGPHPALDICDRLRTAAQQVPGLQTIIEVPLAGASSGAAVWNRFLETGAAGSSGHGDKNRIAALFHTGGTTGNPKLAQLSEYNLAAGALMSAGAMQWRDEDRNIVCLPMFHVGGNITSTMSTLSSGATVIFPSPLGARDPEVVNNIWSMIDKSGASILVMVPTSLSAIHDIPISNEPMTRFRGIMTGSTPLSPDLGAAIMEKTGRPIAQVYGMTETSGVCATQPCDNQRREHAVGYPAPLLELKINSPTDERGEVLMRGPNVFKGYRTPDGVVGAPENGWVGSGDLGQFDADKQLRLLGRSKDTIIRGGHNIDPLVVEETVQAHPAIREAAAVAMPDAYAGELPTLYVSPRPGQDLTVDELNSYVSERIAEPPARPKHIFILDELPLTQVGKVARFRLRQMAAEWRATKSLEGLPVSAVHCQDAAAKLIGLEWRSAPTSDQLSEAVKRMNELGLRYER